MSSEVVTGINPGSIEEYANNIKKWLAQRREISKNLNDLDEQFKDLKGKTIFFYEEDKALDNELAQLQEEVTIIRGKVKRYEPIEKDNSH